MDCVSLVKMREMKMKRRGKGLVVDSVKKKKRTRRKMRWKKRRKGF